MATKCPRRFSSAIVFQGKCAEAEPLYARLLAIRERVYGPDHPKVAVDMNNWAECMRDRVRALSNLNFPETVVRFTLVGETLVLAKSLSEQSQAACRTAGLAFGVSRYGIF